jgi:hypothetical protein
MTVVTVTAKDIIIGLWNIANLDPSKTNGKIGSQKRAFKELLKIRSGVEFVVCKPWAELDELARRGVCSANLRTILPELAGVALQRRKVLSDLESQIHRLLRDAATGTKVDAPITRRKRDG